MADTFSVRGKVTLDTTSAEKRIKEFVKRAEGYNIKSRIDEKSFTQPLGRITGSANEFSKSLEASNARVVAFAASAGLMYAVQRAFVDIVQSAREVEKTLKDINVILNTTSANLSRFGDQLFDIASQTGQTFETVGRAATELARQGLSMEETLRRSRDAMILVRLSGMDAQSAVESLTAAMNTFGTATMNTTELVNKMANVDAAFAVSAKDLAEAIKRVGSSAQDAGLSVDELMGMVTAAQQTTARGGAVIGNSLKSIFTRIQRVGVLQQLEQVGVKVRDLSGEMLPAIQIMKQLAGTLDSLSGSHRAHIQELVGGVFQVNVLKASLGDLGKQYSIYEQALKTSANSTNEAIARNEELNKTLDALFIDVGNNIKKVGADIGQLTIGPALTGSLELLNKGLKAIDVKEAKGLGDKIGKGILEGLGKFISGPGLIMGAGLLGKLLLNFGSFIKDSFKDFFQLNTVLQQRVAIEQQINRELAKNEDLGDAILSGEISIQEAEQVLLRQMQKRTAEQEKMNVAVAEMAILLKSSGVTAMPTGRASEQTYVVKPPRKSSGHIPAVSKGVVPSFAAGGIADVVRKELRSASYSTGTTRAVIDSMPGLGKYVANTRETKSFVPGMARGGQHFINPPKHTPEGRKHLANSIRQTGLNPYSLKQHRMRADGHVPNFAEGKTLPKALPAAEAAAGKKSVQRISNPQESVKYTTSPMILLSTRRSQAGRTTTKSLTDPSMVGGSNYIGQLRDKLVRNAAIQTAYKKKTGGTGKFDLTTLNHLISNDLLTGSYKTTGIKSEHRGGKGIKNLTTSKIKENFSKSFGGGGLNKMLAQGFQNVYSKASKEAASVVGGSATKQDFSRRAEQLSSNKSIDSVRNIMSGFAFEDTVSIIINDTKGSKAFLTDDPFRAFDFSGRGSQLQKLFYGTATELDLSEAKLGKSLGPRQQQSVLRKIAFGLSKPEAKSNESFNKLKNAFVNQINRSQPIKAKASGGFIPNFAKGKFPAVTAGEAAAAEEALIRQMIDDAAAGQRKFTGLETKISWAARSGKITQEKANELEKYRATKKEGLVGRTRALVDPKIMSGDKIATMLVPNRGFLDLAQNKPLPQHDVDIKKYLSKNYFHTDLKTKARIPFDKLLQEEQNKLVSKFKVSFPVKGVKAKDVPDLKLASEQLLSEGAKDFVTRLRGPEYASTADVLKYLKTNQGTLDASAGMMFEAGSKASFDQVATKGAKFDAVVNDKIKEVWGASTTYGDFKINPESNDLRRDMASKIFRQVVGKANAGFIPNFSMSSINAIGLMRNALGKGGSPFMPKFRRPERLGSSAIQGLKRSGPGGHRVRYGFTDKYQGILKDYFGSRENRLNPLSHMGTEYFFQDYKGSKLYKDFEGDFAFRKRNIRDRKEQLVGRANELGATNAYPNIIADLEATMMQIEAMAFPVQPPPAPVFRTPTKKMVVEAMHGYDRAGRIDLPDPSKVSQTARDQYRKQLKEWEIRRDRYLQEVKRTTGEQARLVSKMEGDAVRANISNLDKAKFDQLAWKARGGGDVQSMKSGGMKMMWTEPDPLQMYLKATPAPAEMSHLASLERTLNGYSYAGGFVPNFPFGGRHGGGGRPQFQPPENPRGFKTDIGPYEDAARRAGRKWLGEQWNQSPLVNFGKNITQKAWERMQRMRGKGQPGLSGGFVPNFARGGKPRGKPTDKDGTSRRDFLKLMGAGLTGGKSLISSLAGAPKPVMGESWLHEIIGHFPGGKTQAFGPSFGSHIIGERDIFSLMAKALNKGAIKLTAKYRQQEQGHYVGGPERIMVEEFSKRTGKTSKYGNVTGGPKTYAESVAGAQEVVIGPRQIAEWKNKLLHHQYYMGMRAEQTGPHYTYAKRDAMGNPIGPPLPSEMIRLTPELRKFTAAVERPGQIGERQTKAKKIRDRRQQTKSRKKDFRLKEKYGDLGWGYGASTGAAGGFIPNFGKGMMPTGGRRMVSDILNTVPSRTHIFEPHRDPRKSQFFHEDLGFPAMFSPEKNRIFMSKRADVEYYQALLRLQERMTKDPNYAGSGEAKYDLAQAQLRRSSMAENYPHEASHVVTNKLMKHPEFMTNYINAAYPKGQRVRLEVEKLADSVPILGSAGLGQSIPKGGSFRDNLVTSGFEMGGGAGYQFAPGNLFRKGQRMGKHRVVQGMNAYSTQMRYDIPNSSMKQLKYSFGKSWDFVPEALKKQIPGVTELEKARFFYQDFLSATEAPAWTLSRAARGGGYAGSQMLAESPGGPVSSLAERRRGQFSLLEQQYSPEMIHQREVARKMLGDDLLVGLENWAANIGQRGWVETDFLAMLKQAKSSGQQNPLAFASGGHVPNFAVGRPSWHGGWRYRPSPHRQKGDWSLEKRQAHDDILNAIKFTRNAKSPEDWRRGIDSITESIGYRYNQAQEVLSHFKSNLGSSPANAGELLVAQKRAEILKQGSGDIIPIPKYEKALMDLRPDIYSTAGGSALEGNAFEVLSRSGLLPKNASGTSMAVRDSFPFLKTLAAEGRPMNTGLTWLPEHAKGIERNLRLFASGGFVPNFGIPKGLNAKQLAYRRAVEEAKIRPKLRRTRDDKDGRMEFDIYAPAFKHKGVSHPETKFSRIEVWKEGAYQAGGKTRHKRWSISDLSVSDPKLRGLGYATEAYRNLGTWAKQSGAKTLESSYNVSTDAAGVHRRAARQAGRKITQDPNAEFLEGGLMGGYVGPGAVFKTHLSGGFVPNFMRGAAARFSAPVHDALSKAGWSKKDIAGTRLLSESGNNSVVYSTPHKISGKNLVIKQRRLSEPSTTRSIRSDIDIQNAFAKEYNAANMNRQSGLYFPEAFDPAVSRGKKLSDFGITISEAAPGLTPLDMGFALAREGQVGLANRVEWLSDNFGRQMLQYAFTRPAAQRQVPREHPDYIKRLKADPLKEGSHIYPLPSFMNMNAGNMVFSEALLGKFKNIAKSDSKMQRIVENRGFLESEIHAIMQKPQLSSTPYDKRTHRASPVDLGESYMVHPLAHMSLQARRVTSASAGEGSYLTGQSGRPGTVLNTSLRQVKAPEWLYHELATGKAWPARESAHMLQGGHSSHRTKEYLALEQQRIANPATYQDGFVPNFFRGKPGGKPKAPAKVQDIMWAQVKKIKKQAIEKPENFGIWELERIKGVTKKDINQMFQYMDDVRINAYGRLIQHQRGAAEINFEAILRDSRKVSNKKANKQFNKAYDGPPTRAYMEKNHLDYLSWAEGRGIKANKITWSDLFNVESVKVHEAGHRLMMQNTMIQQRGVIDARAATMRDVEGTQGIHKFAENPIGLSSGRYRELPEEMIASNAAEIYALVRMKEAGLWKGKKTGLDALAPELTTKAKDALAQAVRTGTTFRISVAQSLGPKRLPSGARNLDYRSVKALTREGPKISGVHSSNLMKEARSYPARVANQGASLLLAEQMGLVSKRNIKGAKPGWWQNTGSKNNQQPTNKDFQAALDFAKKWHRPGWEKRRHGMLEELGHFGPGNPKMGLYSSGHVPNFADPNRMREARQGGLNMGQTYTSFVNTPKYTGPVVGNRRDEPTHQALRAAVMRHPDPANAGREINAFRGFIPGFAKMDISAMRAQIDLLKSELAAAGTSGMTAKEVERKTKKLEQLQSKLKTATINVREKSGRVIGERGVDTYKGATGKSWFTSRRKSSRKVEGLRDLRQLKAIRKRKVEIRAAGPTSAGGSGKYTQTQVNKMLATQEKRRVKELAKPKQKYHAEGKAPPRAGFSAAGVLPGREGASGFKNVFVTSEGQVIRGKALEARQRFKEKGSKAKPLPEGRYLSKTGQAALAESQAIMKEMKSTIMSSGKSLFETQFGEGKSGTKAAKHAQQKFMEYIGAPKEIGGFDKGRYADIDKILKSKEEMKKIRALGPPASMRHAGAPITTAEMNARLADKQKIIDAERAKPTLKKGPETRADYMRSRAAETRSILGIGGKGGVTAGQILTADMQKAVDTFTKTMEKASNPMKILEKEMGRLHDSVAKTGGRLLVGEGVTGAALGEVKSMAHEGRLASLQRMELGMGSMIPGTSGWRALSELKAMSKGTGAYKGVSEATKIKAGEQLSAKENALSGKMMMGAFVAPMISQSIAQAFSGTSKGSRMAKATTEGLGETAMFGMFGGSMGASTALGAAKGGLAGLAIGGAMMANKLLETYYDRTIETGKAAEIAADKLQAFANATQGLARATERYITSLQKPNQFTSKDIQRRRKEMSMALGEIPAQFRTKFAQAGGDVKRIQEAFADVSRDMQRRANATKAATKMAATEKDTTSHWAKFLGVGGPQYEESAWENMWSPGEAKRALEGDIQQIKAYGMDSEKFMGEKGEKQAKRVSAAAKNVDGNVDEFLSSIKQFMDPAVYAEIKAKDAEDIKKLAPSIAALAREMAMADDLADSIARAIKESNSEQKRQVENILAANKALMGFSNEITTLTSILSDKFKFQMMEAPKEAIRKTQMLTASSQGMLGAYSPFIDPMRRVETESKISEASLRAKQMGERSTARGKMWGNVVGSITKSFDQLSKVTLEDLTTTPEERKGDVKFARKMESRKQIGGYMREAVVYAQKADATGPGLEEHVRKLMQATDKDKRLDPLSQRKILSDIRVVLNREAMSQLSMLRNQEHQTALLTEQNKWAKIQADNLKQISQLGKIEDWMRNPYAAESQTYDIERRLTASKYGPGSEEVAAANMAVLDLMRNFAMIEGPQIPKEVRDVAKAGLEKSLTRNLDALKSLVGALPGGEAALAGLEKIEGQIPEIAEKKLSAKLRDDEDILSQIEQNIADLDATVREVNLTQDNISDAIREVLGDKANLITDPLRDIEQGILMEQKSKAIRDLEVGTQRAQAEKNVQEQKAGANFEELRKSLLNAINSLAMDPDALKAFGNAINIPDLSMEKIQDLRFNLVDFKKLQAGDWAKKGAGQTGMTAESIENFRLVDKIITKIVEGTPEAIISGAAKAFEATGPMQWTYGRGNMQWADVGTNVKIKDRGYELRPASAASAEGETIRTPGSMQDVTFPMRNIYTVTPAEIMNYFREAANKGFNAEEMVRALNYGAGTGQTQQLAGDKREVVRASDAKIAAAPNPFLLTQQYTDAATTLHQIMDKFTDALGLEAKEDGYVSMEFAQANSYVRALMEAIASKTIGGSEAAGAARVFEQNVEGIFGKNPVGEQKVLKENLNLLALSFQQSGHDFNAVRQDLGNTAANIKNLNTDFKSSFEQWGDQFKHVNDAGDRLTGSLENISRGIDLKHAQLMAAGAPDIAASALEEFWTEIDTITKKTRTGRPGGNKPIGPRNVEDTQRLEQHIELMRLKTEIDTKLRAIDMTDMDKQDPRDVMSSVKENFQVYEKILGKKFMEQIKPDDSTSAQIQVQNLKKLLVEKETATQKKIELQRGNLIGSGGEVLSKTVDATQKGADWYEGITAEMNANWANLEKGLTDAAKYDAVVVRSQVNHAQSMRLHTEALKRDAMSKSDEQARIAAEAAKERQKKENDALRKPVTQLNKVEAQNRLALREQEMKELRERRGRRTTGVFQHIPEEKFKEDQTLGAQHPLVKKGLYKAGYKAKAGEVKKGTGLDPMTGLPLSIADPAVARTALSLTTSEATAKQGMAEIVRSGHLVNAISESYIENILATPAEALTWVTEELERLELEATDVGRADMPELKAKIAGLKLRQAKLKQAPKDIRDLKGVELMKKHPGELVFEGRRRTPKRNEAMSFKWDAIRARQAAEPLLKASQKHQKNMAARKKWEDQAAPDWQGPGTSKKYQEMKGPIAALEKVRDEAGRGMERINKAYAKGMETLVKETPQKDLPKNVETYTKAWVPAISASTEAYRKADKEYKDQVKLQSEELKRFRAEGHVLAQAQYNTREDAADREKEETARLAEITKLKQEQSEAHAQYLQRPLVPSQTPNVEDFRQRTSPQLPGLRRGPLILPHHEDPIFDALQEARDLQADAVIEILRTPGLDPKMIDDFTEQWYQAVGEIKKNPKDKQKILDKLLLGVRQRGSSWSRIGNIALESTVDAQQTYFDALIKTYDIPVTKTQLHPTTGLPTYNPLDLTAWLEASGGDKGLDVAELLNEHGKLDFEKLLEAIKIKDKENYDALLKQRSDQIEKVKDKLWTFTPIAKEEKLQKDLAKTWHAKKKPLEQMFQDVYKDNILDPLVDWGKWGAEFEGGSYVPRTFDTALPNIAAGEQKFKGTTEQRAASYEMNRKFNVAKTHVQANMNELNNAIMMYYSLGADDFVETQKLMNDDLRKSIQAYIKGEVTWPQFMQLFKATTRIIDEKLINQEAIGYREYEQRLLNSINLLDKLGRDTSENFQKYLDSIISFNVHDMNKLERVFREQIRKSGDYSRKEFEPEFDLDGVNTLGNVISSALGKYSKELKSGDISRKDFSELVNDMVLLDTTINRYVREKRGTVSGIQEEIKRQFEGRTKMGRFDEAQDLYGQFKKWMVQPKNEEEKTLDIQRSFMEQAREVATGQLEVFEILNESTLANLEKLREAGLISEQGKGGLVDIQKQINAQIMAREMGIKGGSITRGTGKYKHSAAGKDREIQRIMANPNSGAFGDPKMAETIYRSHHPGIKTAEQRKFEAEQSLGREGKGAPKRGDFGRKGKGAKLFKAAQNEYALRVRERVAKDFREETKKITIAPTGWKGFDTAKLRSVADQGLQMIQDKMMPPLTATTEETEAGIKAYYYKMPVEDKDGKKQWKYIRNKEDAYKQAMAARRQLSKEEEENIIMETNLRLQDSMTDKEFTSFLESDLAAGGERGELAGLFRDGKLSRQGYLEAIATTDNLVKTRNEWIAGMASQEQYLNSIIQKYNDKAKNARTPEGRKAMKKLQDEYMKALYAPQNATDKILEKDARERSMGARLTEKQMYGTHGTNAWGAEVRTSPGAYAQADRDAKRYEALRAEGKISTAAAGAAKAVSEDYWTMHAMWEDQRISSEALRQVAERAVQTARETGMAIEEVKRLEATLYRDAYKRTGEDARRGKFDRKMERVPRLTKAENDAVSAQISEQEDRLAGFRQRGEISDEAQSAGFGIITDNAINKKLYETGKMGSNALAEGSMAGLQTARQYGLTEKELGYDPYQKALGDKFRYNAKQWTEDMQDIVLHGVDALRDNMADAFMSIIDGTKDVKEAFADLADVMLNEVTKMVMQAAISSMMGGIGGGMRALGGGNKGGLVPEFKEGGVVRAGGSGVRDDILAKVHNNEYVIKRSSVSKYGLPFLDAINQGSVATAATGGGMHGGYPSRAPAYVAPPDDDWEGSSLWENIFGGGYNDPDDEPARLEQSRIYAPKGTLISDLKPEDLIDPQKGLTSQYEERRRGKSVDAILRNAVIYDNDLFPDEINQDVSKMMTRRSLMDDLNPKNRFRLDKEKTFWTYQDNLRADEEAYQEELKQYEEYRQGQKNKMMFNMASLFGMHYAYGSGNLLGKPFQGPIWQGNTGGLIPKYANGGLAGFNISGIASLFSGLSASPSTSKGPMPSTYSPGYSGFGRGAAGFGGFDEDPARALWERTGSPIPYANGGPPSQGHALLTEGEFVMSRDAVRKYGIPFMGQLNNGTLPRAANGGLMGSNGGSILNPSTGSNMSNTNNINISVRVDSNGRAAGTVSGGTAGEGRELAGSIEEAVVRVLSSEMRQGGILEGAKPNRFGTTG